jgi:dipeptidyl aminopeptidase/acylaminoacyl peptidase
MRTFLLCALLLVSSQLEAQATKADYERATGRRGQLQGVAINIAEPAHAIPGTSRFWYRKSVQGGAEFVVVDGEARNKRPAFDHEKLAAALSAATGEKYMPVSLPFTAFEFVDNEMAVELTAAGASLKCELTGYTCRKMPEVSRTGQGVRGGSGPSAEDKADNADDVPREFENDVYDGMIDLSPQATQARPGLQFANQAAPPRNQEPKLSPDGEWEALIRNYNIYLRRKSGTEGVALSFDGSEGNYYTLASIAWSPDSRRLVAYRVRPGYRRQLHYVESSPAEQLQPLHWVRDYAKPGDTLDVAQPVLFDLAGKTQISVVNTLFPNPYSLSNPVWWKDGRAFTFEYNQRGHQVYRVIEVDAATGKARALISEEPKTFFSYRPLQAALTESGSRFRRDLNDGKEIIWTSERDGWRHLYLYDGASGRVKNQITKGNWVVRYVDKIDEEKRQIWFQASGMYPGKDPYFTHFYRINFDGTGLAALTEADATHNVVYSTDMGFYVDTYSRVDQPPISQLRRTADQQVVMELERGDISALAAKGWRPPEVFMAMGRDGKTDIWGIIHRPSNFDPSHKYPVIESIYAGPQGSFVPKAFNVYYAPQALAELGFIVVQIDGMGTANRSKAFHDVAWQNLGDAGFADRILWHKAVAAKYPYYDISRVGIYGTSAGGQNSLGGMLFHPEFYKVAVTNSGCHDNRMDKIWWNEQWMGWPLGPHYAASSNVDNAAKLQGKVLLVVGELDTNVDPASTFQVVNALIKANKKYDLLFVPGGGHGAGGAYGTHMLYDFFVHHLQGAEPPEWTQ